MSERGTFTERDTIRFERWLPGPIDRVWTYLTDAELRGRWLAPGPMEPRVGGRVALAFDHGALSPVEEPIPARYAGEDLSMTGQVTRWEPPRLLAFTWDEAGVHASEVTIELDDRGDGVQLTLTHQRLGADVALRGSVAAGWHTHLDILVAVAEGREPAPFWSVHERHEEAYLAEIAAGAAAR